MGTDPRGSVKTVRGSNDQMGYRVTAGTVKVRGGFSLRSKMS
jgi:hypothetical protein